MQTQPNQAPGSAWAEQFSASDIPGAAWAQEYAEANVRFVVLEIGPRLDVAILQSCRCRNLK